MQNDDNPIYTGPIGLDSPPEADPRQDEAPGLSDAFILLSDEEAMIVLTEDIINVICKGRPSEHEIEECEQTVIRFLKHNVVQSQLRETGTATLHYKGCEIAFETDEDRTRILSPQPQVLVTENGTIADGVSRWDIFLKILDMERPVEHELNFVPAERLVRGDRAMWMEDVYDDSVDNPRVVGQRMVEAVVDDWTYNPINREYTYDMTPLISFGHDPVVPGETFDFTRTGAELETMNVMRRGWRNEHERQNRRTFQIEDQNSIANLKLRKNHKVEAAKVEKLRKETYDAGKEAPSNAAEMGAPTH